MRCKDPRTDRDIGNVVVPPVPRWPCSSACGSVPRYFPAFFKLPGAAHGEPELLGSEGGEFMFAPASPELKPNM
jgi:hypothetical protein